MKDRTFNLKTLVFSLFVWSIACVVRSAEATASDNRAAREEAKLFPLSAVRLLDSPFTAAVKANRTYLLALDPDRLLSPLLREAGLKPRKPAYGNWEGSGLGGHTAGHYLSALANMVASGSDTKNGELRRRLDYMVTELARCQQANGDGYVGGVPGSHAFWKEVAAGRIEANGFGINGKWVPWYNLHKTFAGLRDAYQVAGNVQARQALIQLGEWCENITSSLSDAQMQTMLRAEQGGMCEVLADIYGITADDKYLRLAQRFTHHAAIDPLLRQEDLLKGLHANTQIPKVIGLERLATFTHDKAADAAARFFWENVTSHRSVAFGGNSVSEHFNDPKDFSGMLAHREGPETCNTYNMLRLTEQLFAAAPSATYADYYERALYNHILASINPDVPGYVYFTPLRPQHYRVYSQPDQCFWCCVGSGMENPGKYGAFIYAQASDGLYVNLFIASELTLTNLGLALRQETSFPDAPHTSLRHPGWIKSGDFSIRINGKPASLASRPSGYAAIRREWHNGDRVEVNLPMPTTVERLPDGSDWVAILHGPVLLASPAGTNGLTGLRANDSRMGHVANGPMVPLDQVPVLLANPTELASHVKPAPAAGPLHFRVDDVVDPPAPSGLPLVPFFRLQDQRYQMYWQLMTKAGLKTRREQLATEERAKAAREAATLDAVAIGEQQPEVEHAFTGEGTETGVHEGRRWRHGRSFQYTLNTRGEKAADLVVAFWGGDAGRTFDILASGKLLATEQLSAAHPGKFFEKRYRVPPEVLAAATEGRITIQFVAQVWLAGGVYDVRLMRPAQP